MTDDDWVEVDLSNIERMVEWCAARGIRPKLVVAFLPSWFRAK